MSIQIVQDDITLQETEVIVNAANSYLQHGGGVAGAILRAGGEDIQKESDEYIKRYGPVPVSHVAVTKAGRLKAKYIFHAVGPVWGEGNEHEKLYNCVRNILQKADELGIRSISIPAISSGIFGFPKKDCASIFLKAIKDHLSSRSTRLEIIKLCNIDKLTSDIFLETFVQNWGLSLIEEEREIPKLSMRDLIILFFNTVAGRCWARLGLTKDEYGEMRQDLDEARLGIDVLDSILKVLGEKLDQELYKELEGVVANLKLNYVNQYNKSKEAKQ